MADNGIQRQLKAIFSADVKGYSLLMGDDDESTVKTIIAYRKIIAELIETHQGRVVDSPGDNILAEFGSTLNAVNSAIEIQHRLEKENGNLSDKRRMDFRIGINMGDIIHKDERIYGDGVNVASRIESFADSGGICISRGVFDQVKRNVRQGFEYLGEHAVKNIPEPVRIYRILLASEYEGRVIDKQAAKPAINKTTAVIVGLIIISSFTMFLYFHQRISAIEPSLVEKIAFPLPDKPSIAILPFTNMSDDPQQEYFSDGITDDLITDLSKISGLLVIARNSTFTYKGKLVNVKQVAADLGVRYVLEGSVRRAANKVRISTQLIDASTGHSLWAERFDGKIGDIFDLQDSFTQKIVTSLSLKLTGDERTSFTLRYTDNVEAYDAYLKGREQFFTVTRDGLEKAVDYFDKAIALDPEYSSAHAGLSHAYLKSIEMHFNEELGWADARSRALKHLQMAMKNPTPYAHFVVAKNHLYQRRYDEALAAAESAITLDPNYPDGHLLMGMILTFCGRSGEAIKYFNKGMRLDPQYPAVYLYYLGFAQYFLNQYTASVSNIEKSRRLAPQFGPLPLAITYAQLNRGQEAADILSRYFEKRGWPVVFIENTFNSWPFKEQKDLDHWAEGLRKSGLMRPWNPVYRREYEKAIADAEQAIIRDINDANAQYTMGESLVFFGRSAEAIDFLRKAISLDPEYPGYYLFTLGLAQFCLEKYEEAVYSIETCFYKRKMHSNPPVWLLAAIYAYLGRHSDAEDVLSKYIKENRLEDYTVERVLKYHLHAFKDPEDTRRFAQGLHMAGLPLK